MSEVAKGKGKAIGIDLGTTYSCAAVYRNGSVEIIPNKSGNRTTPSVLGFGNEGERLIGENALVQQSRNPSNTIYDSKRMIGRQFTDKHIQGDMKKWPFKVKPDNHGKVMIEIERKGEKLDMMPIEVSAAILGDIKESAEQYMNEEVTGAVITVPAYFGSEQRNETKSAAALAGLNVLRVINEPTAAALAYTLGLKRSSLSGDHEKNVLIFDLGGGTFDISIVCIDGDVVEVTASDGDDHLGGKDFDHAMLDHFKEIIKKKHGIEITTRKEDAEKNKKGYRLGNRIMRQCEAAKRRLSSALSVDFEVVIDGNEEVFEMRRATFNELNERLFTQCIDTVTKVLEDAKKSKSDIEEIILVGGSTRIPEIQERLKRYFGITKTSKLQLSQELHPDEAVAAGASIQAAILAGGSQADASTQDMVMIDITSCNWGLETAGGVMTTLIPKNTTIPATKTQVFSTYADNQTGVDIAIYQGESDMVENNKLVEKTHLSGIQPAPRGVPQIDVTFDINADGVLTVSAKDKASGSKTNIVVEKEDQASEAEIKEMVDKYKTMGDVDKKQRQRVDSILGLEHKHSSYMKSFNDNKSKNVWTPEEENKISEVLEEASKYTDLKDKSLDVEKVMEMTKKLDAEVMPLLGKVYQQQGGTPGGMPGGMPGAGGPGGMGGQPGGDAGSAGPKVEEVR